MTDTKRKYTYLYVALNDAIKPYKYNFFPFQLK